MEAMGLGGKILGDVRASLLSGASGGRPRKGVRRIRKKGLGSQTRSSAVYDPRI